MPKFDKILLISRWKTLGDTVVATALVAEIKRLFPNSYIRVCAKESVAAVWRMTKGVNEVVVYSNAKGIFRFLSDLKMYFIFWQERHDLAIAIDKSPTVLMAEFSGSKKVTGNLVSRVGKLFFSNKAKQFNITEKSPRAKNYLYSLARLGFQVDFNAAAEFEFSDETYRQLADKYDVQGEYAILCPCGSNDSRYLATETVAIIASKLSGKYSKVFMIGTESQRSYIGSCVSDIDKKTNLAGKLSISELFHLISKASLFVSVDTGSMHIGDVLKVPMIALFGADDANFERCKPRNANVVTVQVDNLCNDYHVYRGLDLDKLCELIITMGDKGY